MSQASKDDLLAELKSHQLPATLLDAVSYKLRQLEYAEQKVQLLEERLRLQRIESYNERRGLLGSTLILPFVRLICCY